jgi:uncharacterized membrane protein
VTSPASGPSPEVISPRATAFIIGVAIVFGTLVRVSFVAAADFPLADGGMFYAMSSDLQTNGFQIPAFTTYNFDRIPFAYPPLGFYAAAAVESATPISMLDVFRLLPLSVSIATMFAFVALARRMLDDRVALVAAVAAFALVPRSFEWMIMGGGVTRSFGLLFAILALHEAHRLCAGNRRMAVIALGLFGGLTLLSHLELAWFLAFSVCLLVAFEGRSRGSVIGAIAAAAIAIAVSAPWWIAVLGHHGVSPFLAAATTGAPSQTNPIIVFLVFQPTGEPMFALIAALALLGVIACLGDKRWLLPLWVLMCGLLDPRGFGTVAVVPLAMLAGVAVSRVLLPLLLRRQYEDSGAKRWIMPGAVFVLVGLYALMNALIATPQLLQGMSRDERAAMSWVATNTPPGARFVVVSNESWASDRTSEWFPVLAQRRSVATVQGYEWVRGAFAERLAAYRDLQSCAEKDASCVDAWQSAEGTGFDYIYVPKVAELQQGEIADPFECCAALRLSLRAGAHYEAVYDGPGATVFERKQ